MEIKKGANKVAPYLVRDSGKTVADVFEYVNRVVFQGHGPDVKQRGGAVGVMVDPIHHYECLMRDLHDTGGLTCLTFDQALSEPCPDDEIRCLIRHDVDIDVRTALIMAEIEKKYDVKTSYYILHTSPYYGEFKEGIFYRNESMIHVYRRIQELGHEIALHTDPLLLYQEYDINGAEAVEEEIRWLRSHGIRVIGTTAHNSIGVYGAENFAIFKGRAQGMSGKLEDCPPEIIHNGKWAPLGVLDEKEMGLHYEANDIFLQGDISVKYAATRAINRWRWQSEMSRPILRSPGTQRPENCFVSHDSLIDRIREIDLGSYLVLVVHPVYYGCRHAVDSGPVMEANICQIVLNEKIGWETYAPESILAYSAGHEGVQEFQSISKCNEIGMLDFPLPAVSEEELVKIAVFGGTNVNAASIGVPAQMHCLLAEKLNALNTGKVHVSKFAFPGMGFSRYFNWYRKVEDLFKPDVAVLAIGADEVMMSLPEHWAWQSGFNKAFPPGAYLNSDGNNVELVASSLGALIRRRSSRHPKDILSLCRSASDWPSAREFGRAEKSVGAMLRYCVEQIIADRVLPVFLIQECGENVGRWRHETPPEQNMQGHSHFIEWLQEYVGDLGVKVIDPYTVFLKQPKSQFCHWHSVPEWNCRGHEAAAEEAFRVISEMNIFNRKVTD